MFTAWWYLGICLENCQYSMDSDKMWSYFQYVEWLIHPMFQNVIFMLHKLNIFHKAHIQTVPLQASRDILQLEWENTEAYLFSNGAGLCKNLWRHSYTTQITLFVFIWFFRKSLYRVPNVIDQAWSILNVLNTLFSMKMLNLWHDDAHKATRF